MRNPYDEDFLAEDYNDWLFQGKRSTRTQLVGLLNLIVSLLPLVITSMNYIPLLITLTLTAITYYLIKIFVYNKRMDQWREWDEKKKSK